MHVSELRIRGYKRYRDSGPITLAPGVNVIVGANDVGKTALIEALGGAIVAAPHRSQAAVPDPQLPPAATTEIDLVVSYGPGEIERAFARHPRVSVDYPGGQPAETAALFMQVAREGDQFVLKRTGQPSRLSRIPQSAGGQAIVVNNLGAPSGFSGSLMSNSIIAAQSGFDYATLLAQDFQSRLYAFKAERFNVSMSAFGSSAVLAPDARNLPEVLNTLQANSARYERLLGHLRSVFPWITDVRVSPLSNSHLMVKVWDVAPSSEREDLAVPLSESGTGIGQVLAMLYVVATAPHAQVILIDEPHSFLHPGALRKLFQIFSRHYPQHQYVITTNSPTAILSATPATVNLVVRENHESTVRRVDTSDSGDMSLFLASVGASLADVFGADRILWVEGKTEELCVPLLLAAHLPDRTEGLAVRGVVHTGDLLTRDARRIFDIYRRLASGATLMPPAVAFVFDREGRRDTELHEMREMSRGLLSFLERRMFESYLLIPAAIAAVLTGLDAPTGHRHSEEQVQEWLGGQGMRENFFDRGVPPRQPLTKEWFAEVHGANVLAAIFSELSETRIQYEKVAHGIALTKHGIERGDGPLRQLTTNIFGARLGVAPQ